MANSVVPAGLFPAVSMFQKRFFLTWQRRGPRRAASLALAAFFLVPLERQLQGELDQPGIARALHAPEIAAVGEVPLRLKELRVVEGVEKLSSKLQLEALAERRNLLERNLPVVDSRPAANRSWRVSNGARRHSVLGKGVGVEAQVAGPARIELVERRRNVRLPGRLEIETGLQL